MLKDLVQAFLRRFGVKLSRIAVNEAPLVPFNVFEHVLFKEIHAAGEMFRFIQIGANDGVMSDNLAPLIRKYSITGCLVEPMPDVFLELVSNYSDQPQLLFKNYLISSNDVGEKIYRFKRDAPVPQEFYHGLARQDSEYIIKRAAAAGLPNHIEEIVCSAKTFAELYSELGWKSLNLLYVDTKGAMIGSSTRPWKLRFFRRL